MPKNGGVELEITLNLIVPEVMGSDATSVDTSLSKSTLQYMRKFVDKSLSKSAMRHAKKLEGESMKPTDKDKILIWLLMRYGDVRSDKCAYQSERGKEYFGGASYLCSLGMAARSSMNFAAVTTSKLFESMNI